MSANPGLYLPFGMVMIDEPESFGMTTFVNPDEGGDVLVTINCRPGGNVTQVLLGLTANQAVQLMEGLQKYSDVYLRAIATGKGGVKFTESPKE